MSIFKFKKKKKKSKLKNIVNMLKYNKKLFLIVFLFILLITTTSIISLANFGGGQTENTPNLQRGLVGHWTMDENSYVEGTENLAENGDFQDGLTAWSTSAHNSSVYNYSVSVVDAPDAPFGDKALRVYRKYNEGENYGYLRIHNSYKNINEGETIVFHGWYKILEKGMGAPTLRFQYGGSTKRTVTADDSIIGQWQYLSGSYTVPEGEGGNYRVYVDYNHGRDGEVLWNAIQWERKSNPTPFVNGTRQTRLADSTPYGNHGTIAIENSPTLGSDRFGNDSGAVKFNGVNNFINIGSNNSIKPNKGTIVAWIKPHSIGGEQIILSRAGGGIVHRMPYFRLSGSNLAAMITNGVTSQSISYSAGLNENTWYQVAFFYDGNKTGFYINGEKVHELSQNFPASPSGSMRIGEFHPPDFSRPFNGIIDDIRIYNRALLPEEINLLYGSYKPQLQVSSLNSGLIGHWSLSEVDYNPLTFRVSDLTPYSNHGTNYGATFTSNRFGKEGGAMNFDGDSDYIELPHVSILNNLDGGVFGNSSWTTSFWINPERFGANNACGDDRAHIFGKGLIGGESYNSIRLTNNGTLSYITTHTGHSYSFGVSTSLLLNQFTNITLTHNSDTNQLLLYKNGLFVDSTNTDAGFGPGANV